MVRAMGQIGPALAVAAAGVVARAQNCGVSFADPHSFDTGGGPSALAAGDFNNDQIADLAVVGRIGSTVSILTGNGDGTFQPQLLFAVGDRPVAIAVADFNNDHNLDFVTADRDNGTITVRRGMGNGNFLAAILTTAGAQPSAVVTGDFNTDGFADVAVAEKFGAQVRILLGQGNGSFNAPSFKPCSDPPVCMTGVDLNGDSLPDLVAGTTDGSVIAYIGHADGTFDDGLTTEVFDPLIWVDAADFDSDGVPDLVVSTNSGPRFMHGNGDGTFDAPEVIALTGYPAVAGDFNGDQDLDIAVSLQGATKSIKVYTGDGDGTFTPAPEFAIDGVSFAVLASDLTADAKPDLVACIEASNYCTVFVNDGTPPPSITVQPADAVSHYNPVTFSVVAQGESLQYQWKKDDADLSDGGHYSGTHADTLTISPVGPADTGQYTVTVSNACGSRTSDPGFFQYYCPADFDENTFVNGDDFDSFMYYFDLGAMEADFDGNTFVNGDDFDYFTAAFAAGC